MGSCGGQPRCFAESGQGAAALLSILGRCPSLEDTTELTVSGTAGFNAICPKAHVLELHSLMYHYSSAKAS